MDISGYVSKAMGSNVYYQPVAHAPVRAKMSGGLVRIELPDGRAEMVPEWMLRNAITTMAHDHLSERQWNRTQRGMRRKQTGRPSYRQRQASAKASQAKSQRAQLPRYSSSWSRTSAE